MPQYLKDYGERLVELGYRIVPLPPGSKGPHRKGWPKFNADADQVRRWYSNGSANDGIGVLAATTPAIDVDILDREVAGLMADEIDRIFEGHNLLMRTGKAPKFLIPFRSDEPFRKITSSVYTDGTNEHKVEILGDGQQWVAYHTHPETGKPYQWWDGVSDAGISVSGRDNLPELTFEDAQRVIDAFERIAADRVALGKWRVTSRVQADPRKVDGADDFAAHAEPVKDLTRSQIEWLVHKCDHTDYEEWIDVGMRLHHQYAGEHEGFEIWDAWSANSHKYDAAVIETHWESFGHRTDAPKTIRGLIDNHGQPPGPRKDEHKPRADGSDNPFAVHEWADYKQHYLSTPWIIKGVLPQAEVGILYGQSGSGKTFFMLDLAATVARGADWRGRKVSDCRVVYVAAEAREGIKKRMDAYDQHICADGIRPAIIASAPNLLSTDTSKLAEAIGSAGLIILDTMAASHSGDENSAKDMGLFLAACKDLSHATGAMVLAVHHTGKEDSKGMRGSSALFAGADFVMEVFKNDNEHGAMLSKSRDDVTGTSFSFVLKRVVVGHDEDGDEVTTCVVEPIQKEVSKVTKKPKKLANTNDTRYDFSREMLALIEDLAYKSNTGKVHKDEIFEQLLHKYPGKLKRNLAAVLLRLEQLGAIRQTLDWYSVEEDEEALG
jgi:hypothetical protein